MRYATVDNWARYFEETEGVQITGDTIRDRLKKVEKIGLTARNKIGKLLKNAFYSEADVREICADLLTKCPQADENGFFVKNKILYASVNGWVRYFKEQNGIRVGSSTLYKYLKVANKIGITARDKFGHVRQNGYFSKSDVMEVMAGYFKGEAQVDEHGYFKIGNTLYASCNTWAAYLNEKNGTVINSRTIQQKLKAMGKTGISARDINGLLHKNIYFSETDIFEAVSDYINTYPKADENGFVDIKGVRFASIKTWTKFFNGQGIRIGVISVDNLLKENQITGITAINASGRLCVNGFFAKEDTEKACSELLIKYPEADKDGFLELNGQIYATKWVLYKHLTMTKKIKTVRADFFNLLVGKEGITGRDSNGRLLKHAFFSVSEALSACADLLAKRKSEKPNPKDE